MEPLQEQIAKGIVNIFETGRLLGDYSSVVVAPNDRGHLTYGRSQTTLASGNLYVLMSGYCSAPGAALAQQLSPYLPRLQSCDLTLDDDVDLRRLLEQAGADPAMRQAQDAFFDREYWQPATRRAIEAAVTTPLGVATIYDSTIHGNYVAIKTSADAVVPMPRDENAWVRQYITLRRAWLASNSNPGLRPTVYRMEELRKLADAGNWGLEPPLVVRGITITAASFAPSVGVSQAGTPPVRASAHDAEEVTLSLRVPYQTGSSVVLLQHALIHDGLLAESDVDGVFGPLTSALVKQFQLNHGLGADGIVGPATWATVRQVTGGG
jgi:chitosanase